MDRLNFALDHVCYVRQENCFEFLSMYDSFHPNKKRSYIMKEKETYYRTPSEKNSHCSTKCETFNKNLMFLCTIKRKSARLIPGLYLMEKWYLAFSYESNSDKKVKN